MKKSVEEMKTMSESELDSYFKSVLKTDFQIEEERVEAIELMMQHISEVDNPATTLDTMALLKKNNPSYNELLLLTASMHSKVDGLVYENNKLKDKLKELMFKDIAGCLMEKLSSKAKKIKKKAKKNKKKKK